MGRLDSVRSHGWRCVGGVALALFCSNRTFVVLLKSSIRLIEPRVTCFFVKFCHYRDRRGGNDSLIACVVVYNHKVILGFFLSPSCRGNESGNNRHPVRWWAVQRGQGQNANVPIFNFSHWNNNHPRLTAPKWAKKWEKPVSAFIRTKGGWAGERLTSQ